MTPESSPVLPAVHDLEVPASELRWRCDSEELAFETTDDVEPILGVVGQDDAIEALRFGLAVHAPGQNVFVRGLTGTGRSSLVRHLLEEHRPPGPAVGDLCYVHDFGDPARPRLIELERGRGAAFRDGMNTLVDFIGEKLGPALASDTIRARAAALEKQAQTRVQRFGQDLENELRAHGLGLVTMRLGPVVQPAIVPLVDGEPAPPDRLAALIAEGKISQEDAQALTERAGEFAERLAGLESQMRKVQIEHAQEVRALYEGETRRLLDPFVAELREGFPGERVEAFLGALVEDVIRTRLAADAEGVGPPLGRYRVNLVLEHAADEPPPVLVETTPTLRNLLGTVDRRVSPQGLVHSDHTMIAAGSLLRAHGGYLILEARDVLSEPGAWKVLVRTLRTGKLEIVPEETLWFGVGVRLQPEPIAVDVKVVLLGDPELYALLDNYDHDFPNLFKVLADFDSSIPRGPEGLRYYAGVLARIVRDEGLLPFERDAVTVLAEHGARVAARRDRLTARFGRLADLVREAAFLARERRAERVQADDVRDAVRRTKRRADLPSRKFRQLIREGTIRIQTEGAEVGQINGLAVTHSGQLSYGFPARITATIGAGSAGAINIEREAMLSGAIHTKGFYILGGLLRYLLRTPHPLAFSASIAFEQSYGGIDGDSASGAEMCCLLSALTEIPLRQDVAMTGAIDQHGHIQPVGATTEKIEGFFDVCSEAGLAGTEGVLVPRANLGDLMLREDVVTACAEGRFHVWAVDTIQQALEVLTGVPAGERDEEGLYPEDSLLGIAVEQAGEFWSLVSRMPLAAGQPSEEEHEEPEQSAAAEN